MRMAKDKNKKDKGKKKSAPPADPTAVAVAEIEALTKQVRTLEQRLDTARLERRGAMRKASELGVTHYRIAKAAETSQSSATRMIRDDVR
jgi:ParB-like chromosome segregation protein Spo0J